MARLGSNPSRQKKTDFKPARITVAVLVYVPSLDGYFKNRFETLKLTLESILQNTKIGFDLMVFDNGSCKEVGAYLQALKIQGKIDYLLSSPRNLGNWGALRIMFPAAPGEIIAYCDDDVIHHPGWLKPQIDILETFPKVGMVSGAPVRNARGHADDSLDDLVGNLPNNMNISLERRIKDEWERGWAISTDRDVDAWMEKTKDWQDLVLEKDGLEAIGHGNHFQFVGYKEVLIQGIPQGWEGELMGDMVQVDKKIDDLGFIRLSTVDRLVRHLGNAVSEEMAKEVKEMGFMKIEASDMTRVKRHWILNLPGAGRILMSIYNWIYKIIFTREEW